MKYGFIGIGNMGHFMASNCLKAGYKIVVSEKHSATRAKELEKEGAEVVDSNIDVAKKVDILFLCLPNGKVVNNVIDEIFTIENLSISEVYDFSTISPNQSKRNGEKLKSFGVKYYDCPIAGGVAGAEAGTLSIMIGCEEAEFAHIKDVVSPMGKTIMHAGHLGSGAAVKMFNNYIGGSGLVACCEVMVMAKQLDMDVERVFEIINKSTGRNFATEMAIPGFLKNRNFEPGFATDLFYKDINLAMETAVELKLPINIGPATLQAFGATMAMGFGKEHSIAVVKYYEKLAGVKVNEDKK